MNPAMVSSARSRSLAALRREMTAGERAAGDRVLGTRAIPSGRLRKMTCRVRAPKLPRSLCELHPAGDLMSVSVVLGSPVPAPCYFEVSRTRWAGLGDPGAPPRRRWRGLFLV